MCGWLKWQSYHDHTGTTQWLADHLVGWAGGYGRLVPLGSLLLFTTLVTEVISDAAAGVLLAPIGIGVQARKRLQPHPILMSIVIGASTTFLTPIDHQ